MATSEQILALLEAYSNNDRNQFKLISLQIAADEAVKKHQTLANKIKKLADNFDNQLNNKVIYSTESQNNLFSTYYPSNRMTEIVVNNEINSQIYRIIEEYKNRKKLASYGMCNRRRILLEGEPGTGKTFTASVIATELRLPLYVIQMDKIVSKFMGETSVKLREIFDEILSYEGVYLFDEFDAIGANRNLDNEVGEARRILNSFLQFVEQDFPDSIIIAATNNKKILDQALFRRFDDILHYTLPTKDEIKRILQLKFGTDNKVLYTEKLLDKASELCHADIIKACDNALKDSILNDIQMSEELIMKHLIERNNFYRIDNTCRNA